MRLWKGVQSYITNCATSPRLHDYLCSRRDFRNHTTTTSRCRQHRKSQSTPSPVCFHSHHHNHVRIHRPYLILAIRPQEHDRRRPPELPQQPQVQADPHTDRCAVSPRLHGRHHRRRTLLLRLEVRLGGQQALHTACCRRILSVEYRIQLLAMVRGEGCSV